MKIEEFEFVEKLTEDDEIEELLDGGEIDAWEAGFMHGCIKEREENDAF